MHKDKSHTVCVYINCARKNIYRPYPAITIIVIVFLQYRYIGDLFMTIPRNNDVILPDPW